MTNDDVMIIFDSKGDFYSKFFCPNDIILGNSPQYQKTSVEWNIFKEIVADGWDNLTIDLNAQEICKSFFTEKIDKTNNVFFHNAAQDVLASILTIFIRSGRADKEFARRMLYNDSFMQFINKAKVESLLDLMNIHDDMNAIVSYIGGKKSITRCNG